MRRKKLFRSRTVSSSVEKLVVTGLITSDRFSSEFYPLYNPKLFKMEASRIVSGWCLDYFDQTGHAPDGNIESIFEIEKEGMDKASINIVSKFLLNLSEDFTGSSFNSGYVLNEAKKYFKDRLVETTAEEAHRMVTAGRPDRALQLMEGFKEAVIEVDPTVNLLNDPSVMLLLNREDGDVMYKEDSTPYGQLIGNLNRGWLVSFIAPMKRGKTWYLMDMAKNMIMGGKKVYFVSLEMNEYSVLDRLYKVLTKMHMESDKEETITVPAFDCYSNQDGSCTLSQRTNRYKLLEASDGDLSKPVYNPRARYKPCIACCDDPNNADNYIQETWFDSVKAKPFKKNGRKAVSQMKILAEGGDMVVKTFPTFSASTEDILKDINKCKTLEGFIPDAVIIDYADIIKHDSSIRDDRHKHDDTWKKLKGISVDLNCIVLTATQGNRKSIESTSVRQTHMSEDIRKLAHVDAMFAINQTEDERRNGIARIGMLAHRHREIIDRNVICLQAYKLGQPVWDSDWMDY